MAAYLWLCYRAVTVQGYPTGVYLIIIFTCVGVLAGGAVLWPVFAAVLEHWYKIRAAEGVARAGGGIERWGEGQARRGQAEQERARRESEAERGRVRRRR
ncbi:hypothetical protein G3I44_14040 [Halogeometricum borinquense]|uniref:Uncharacterized protein n=1 Tax=Halogeometricum borinquense TaxID=60847 RepID=A0A6C0UJB4_9EURY|nr:hypothetical protein [Halogeometricum borinquense]QIB75307.1 hypothetical protein G3I44_14040 [Halogeometricum borinquense]